MSQKQANGQKKTEDNKLYYVQITEPTSGKLRIFYLYDGVNPEEIKALYQASFESNSVAKGFTDETGVVYPPSMLALNPSLFAGRKLYVINENVIANVPTSLNRQALGLDSQDTLLTEEQVRKAFQILDVNSDNVIHKEEFIDSLSQAFNNLFELDPGLAFAYSCLGSKDLAIVTATTCYHRIQSKGPAYFLTYDDFCAWYMSTGFDPLRELTIRAIEVYSNHRLASNNSDDDSLEDEHHLKRSKSRPTLEVSKCYRDVKIRAFINQMRESFQLDLEALIPFIQALKNSTKYFSYISTVITDNIPSKSSAGVLLNLIYDVIDNKQTGKVPSALIISLFVLCSDDTSTSLFDELFQYYQESSSSSNRSKTLNNDVNLINDIILLNHLTVVFRIIFYFNRDYIKVTGCTADQLSHAIYLKLLLLVEVQRRSWGKLTRSEFIELFIHGLHLGLSILQISNGYFYDLLTKLLGYFPATFKRSFNLPSSASSDNDNTEDGYVSDEGDDDDDNNDDVDNDNDDDDEDLLRTNTEDLEEDQVTSFLVGYNGAAITISEANELLGLNEYSTYDLIKYFIQLTNKDGYITISNFNRGILKLIGEHYISLTVLQRSIVDFLLDQLTKIFALGGNNSNKNNNNNSTEQENTSQRNTTSSVGGGSSIYSNNSGNTTERFSLLEISIVLLLFCDDDTFTRGEIILALIRPKALKFSIVYEVVSHLYKACYALNPLKSIQEIEGKADTDARAICVEFYMNHVAQKINPLRQQQRGEKRKNRSGEDEEEEENNDDDSNISPDQTTFTNTQFLKFINMVFTKLENESERFKVESSAMIQKSSKDTNDDEEVSEHLEAFSGEDDDESDGLHLFLDDDRFPPSSTVLELRGAVSILGLECYKADDLIDKLGGQCYVGGKLSAQGWSRWFANVLQEAKISSFDMDLAIALGNKIFAAFQIESEETIHYIDLAVGLAFLCSRSPIEERLMVAFTISDSDSDGFITFEEFKNLIRSVLVILSVCSRLVTKKILALGATIDELATAAAYEGIGALGVSEEDELTLEMLCDLAEDYLKLAALV